MKTISALMLVGCVAFAGCAVSSEPTSGEIAAPAAETKGKPAPTTQISPLTVTVAEQTTTTITLKVCAGATGAPAGFSIQWMPGTSVPAVWPEFTGTEFCKASFSGNAHLSSYDLAPLACMNVEIPNLFDDPGASFSPGCDADLSCTIRNYVFRYFGHATSTLKRSVYGELAAQTLACETHAGCTYTQGYWKTNTTDKHIWPVAALTIGGVEYTQAELLTFLGTPAKGNGIITVGHQLIAALLNVANGATADAATAAAIASAQTFIAANGGLGGTVATSTTSEALTEALDNFNNGIVGPGHCGDEPPPPPAE
jgi:hypothetical protein